MNVNGRQMTPQSRKMSAIEACTSTAIGLLVAYVTQLVAFPLFGIHGTSTGVHVGLTLVFTGVSLVRGYFVRRLFNRLQRSPLARWKERARKRQANREPMVFRYVGRGKPTGHVDDAEVERE